MATEILHPVINGANNVHEAISNGFTSAPKAPTLSMIELAAIISKQTSILDQYLKENGLPTPGFDYDSPLNFPKLPNEIKKAREEVMKATKDLGDLVTGPTESLRWSVWDFNNSLSLQAVYKYKIAKSFPVTETTTFAEIAAKVGLDEPNVTRLLRHAMTNRIFKETSPGVVAHTAISRVLAEDAKMDDWIGFNIEDIFPASAVTLKALELNPAADDITQTGFNLANGTTNIEPMFATFGKDPARAKRMGGAMVSLTGGEGYEPSWLLENYPWATLNATSASLVDVGGSHGFICLALAEKYPNMTFTVQDLPKTIASAPPIPSHLANRIIYQPHDFYTPQPVKGADVYFFRWILHNQADKYAIKMLRQLIPALKKGAKVLINDHCLREPGQEGYWDERLMRGMDLIMLMLLNAKERSEVEFRELFGRVDGRFRFVGVERVQGCRMSVVEAVWEGEDYCEAVV